jgi:hypothetical protein
MGELRCGLTAAEYERIHCVPLDTPDSTFGDMDAKASPSGITISSLAGMGRSNSVEYEIIETAPVSGDYVALGSLRTHITQGGGK